MQHERRWMFMDGQELSYDQKNEIITRFIEMVDPYKPLVPLRFDLRGYAKYVEENNLTGEDITDDILLMFRK